MLGTKYKNHPNNIKSLLFSLFSDIMNIFYQKVHKACYDTTSYSLNEERKQPLLDSLERLTSGMDCVYYQK